MHLSVQCKKRLEDDCKLWNKGWIQEIGQRMNKDNIEVDLISFEEVGKYSTQEIGDNKCT